MQDISDLLCLEPCEVPAPLPGGPGSISISLKQSDLAVVQRHQHTLAGFDCQILTETLLSCAWAHVCTQTEKALKPPKKENCVIQLLQLLPLISSGLTDIDFSTRAPCPAFINIMPRYHIHSCMPARFLIPQLCCCRPCVLLKYFLVAQRHLVFNSKCSIHSSFFP